MSDGQRGNGNEGGANIITLPWEVPALRSGFSCSRDHDFGGISLIDSPNLFLPLDEPRSCLTRFARSFWLRILMLAKRSLNLHSKPPQALAPETLGPLCVAA